jgi:hypothetical protein
MLFYPQLYPVFTPQPEPKWLIFISKNNIEMAFNLSINNNIEPTLKNFKAILKYLT